MNSPRQSSHSSALDPLQWPPIFEQWSRNGRARFERLYKEIQDWDSRKGHDRTKTELLRKLDEVKKHNLEYLVTGHLRQTIFQSQMRSAMHQEKQDRSALYREIIRSLEHAAEGLRQLTQRDKDRGDSCTVGVRSIGCRTKPGRIRMEAKASQSTPHLRSFAQARTETPPEGFLPSKMGQEQDEG